MSKIIPVRIKMSSYTDLKQAATALFNCGYSVQMKKIKTEGPLSREELYLEVKGTSFEIILSEDKASESIKD